MVVNWVAAPLVADGWGVSTSNNDRDVFDVDEGVGEAGWACCGALPPPDCVDDDAGCCCCCPDIPRKLTHDAIVCQECPNDPLCAHRSSGGEREQFERMVMALIGLPLWLCWGGGIPAPGTKTTLRHNVPWSSSTRNGREWNPWFDWIELNKLKASWLKREREPNGFFFSGGMMPRRPHHFSFFSPR